MRKRLILIILLTRKYIKKNSNGKKINKVGGNAIQFLVVSLVIQGTNLITILVESVIILFEALLQRKKSHDQMILKKKFPSAF